MSSAAVVGLQFSYRELMRETEALRGIAAAILMSDGPLRDFARNLERIGQRSAERDCRLELLPLRTQPTRGYEPARRVGGQKVYARVRGVWQVRPVGRKRPGRRIAFVGSASAVVELWPADCLYREKCERSQRIAMWRIELGAHDSPGCYFHVQILGDGCEAPFPNSIPIPRLPSPFVTPMAAVEYVLGELFQDDWKRKTTGARNHHRDWRAIQRQRCLSLMKWQREALDEGESSPWMNLKAAKPPDDLFVN